MGAAFQVPAVSVPTPVMPVYDPEIRLDAIVPLVIWLAAIAIGVFDAEVSCPCALTANVATFDAVPYDPATTVVLLMLKVLPVRVSPVPARYDPAPEN